ncbi:MAG: hypothetical protein EHM23_30830 [Acidobacteria bacterium]|nr:MAG: hypothetical protein EHM23_30830 [Acidobacteriota bacterium]
MSRRVASSNDAVPSVQGTGWYLAIALAMIPVSYLTQVLLGRMGPVALAYYALVFLAREFITNVFMLGENQTIVRFLPAIPANQRPGFLVRYLLIVSVPACLLVAGISQISSLRHFLIPEHIPLDIVLLLLIFVPITLLFNTCVAALQALLQMKVVGLWYRGLPLLNLLGFLAVYRYLPALRKHETGFWVVLIVLVSYLLSLAALAVFLHRQCLAHWTSSVLSTRLPRGFFRYMGFIGIGTISSFVIENFDQTYILSALPLEQLGHYRAALSTAKFVPWLPLIMIQITMPLFSQLEAAGDDMGIRKHYARMMSLNISISSAIACLVMLFARPILSLFGPTYASAYTVLIALATGLALHSITTVNSSLLLAKGYAGINLVGALAASGCQVFLIVSLIGPLGPTGVAISRGVTLLLLVLITSYFVSKFACCRIPSAQFAWLAALGLVAAFGLLISDQSGAGFWLRIAAAVLVVAAAGKSLRSIEPQLPGELWRAVRAWVRPRD